MAADLLETLERLRAARSGGRYVVLGQIEDGSETREQLRTVRRKGPGRLRAAALDVLGYLGGEAALDTADTAAVERLIRIRRRTDAVGPVMSCWTFWWCIRSNDQAAVIASLGLTDPRPVTYALACSVVDILEHEGGDHGLVYVGPAVNGWTPVVGPSCDAFIEPRGEVQAAVELLSAQYGEAHAFYFGAQGDGSAWLIARDGVTVRRYSSLDPAASIGAPLTAERDWARGNGAGDEFPEANDIAAAISLDVGWHHPPDTVLEEGPVLARLPGHAAAPLPPGAYEI